MIECADREFILKRSQCSIMSYAAIYEPSELQFIFDETVFISGKKSLEKEEISENMWAISFDESLVAKMTLQDLQDFLSQLLRKRIEQIRPLSIPATFYICRTSVTHT